MTAQYVLRSMVPLPDNRFLPIGILQFSGNLELIVSLYHAYGPPLRLERNTNGCRYSGNRDEPKLFIGIHGRTGGGLLMVASPDTDRIEATLDYFLDNTLAVPVPLQG